MAAIFSWAGVVGEASLVCVRLIETPIAEYGGMFENWSLSEGTFDELPEDS